MGSKDKKKASAGDSTGDNDNGNKLISDPRFSKVHTDPRFSKAPKHKAKVSIDPRFNQMFVDKRFSTSSAPVDKRGKRKKQSENSLRRYYHLEDQDKIEKAKADEVTELSSESPSSEPEPSASETESSESEELESDGSSSTTDTDDDADDVEMIGDEASVEVENVPMIENETHRLAVVNMDWNQVKAVDLFMMLKSCLPKGGEIKSVTVYPSEFGLKRMAEEAVHGPLALFNDEEKDGKDDKDDDDDDDDEDEIDTEKLRAYEKSKLRYYYAVVECDSVATADYIYKACDGLEFERSSNVLDLRFIPDSMEFPHPPRDVAKEVPGDYEGLDFHTRALQHSNVLLSWDDDDPHRKKKLRRKFNDKQLDELEFKDFLASDESESDEDGNSDEDITVKKQNKVDKYRALIEAGDGSEEEDEDEGQDMEVTFNTGLEDLSKKILEKKDKKSETVWEAYLKKRKEKKRTKKNNRSKNSSDDESDYSDEEPHKQVDDFFEDDISGQGNKKKREEKKSVEDKAVEASRAELELLLADEKGMENNVKGYKIKQKKGKGKRKGKEAPDEDKLPTVEHDDPRFAALFSNPGFALDPTDPQFKRSATYYRQLAQQQQKGREENAEKEQTPLSISHSNGSTNEDKPSVNTRQKEKRELSAIVKSLKMKSQQLHLPSSSVKLKKDKPEVNGSTLKEKKHKLSSLDHQRKKKAKV